VQCNPKICGNYFIKKPKGYDKIEYFGEYFCRMDIMKLLIVVLVFLNSSFLYANSSWKWFAGNPITVLPYVTLFTLVSEIFMIIKINKITTIKNIVKTFLVIILANFTSFLLPYLFMGLWDELEYNYGFLETLKHNISKFPFYIINIGYLFITIIIEIPIIYNLLKKQLSIKEN
jgi:hypothetical protein